MTEIRVEASRSYSVLIEKGLLDQVGERLRALSRATCAVIVSGSRVFPLYGERLRLSLEKAGFQVLCFTHPSGEEHKNLQTYGELLRFLSENRVTRSDVLLALGGGVTGDLCGFAAATYLRGVDYVQVPTSLLAMVDSSVGGKTAVDLPTGKNQVGCFYQPLAVFCDPDTLSSLPGEQLRCGLAEVVKYGLLKDERFFDTLFSADLADRMDWVIRRCVEMKRDLVREDEFDRGSRQLLNLGHSVGHAVEACSGFSILHGQAVAIGMAAITRAAVQKGLCDGETLDRLLALLGCLGLPTELPYPAERLLEEMTRDKKRSGDRMNLIVPERIGVCRILPVKVDELRDWLTAGGAK